MARTKVMKLWTAFVTAFLALCTALGLVAVTAPAATARTGSPTESPNRSTEHHTAPATATAAQHRIWPQARSLPPTMKQRIRAEAHGKSPHSRNRARSALDTATKIPHRLYVPEQSESSDRHTPQLDC
ncbi:hypothetical protein GTW40_29310 [Streptomyces sp. SID4985]|uniref:DUF6344 domain-containing protein n=1 Tax=unclassified Streptomyces TaxID=2593676 RepID=UPI00136C6FB0|nr:DUF6344 domain-containing protein [Streptomyces sp. SID4985]MYQ49072.1 hypothetical protein [Streptomyces sp. SID4985]